MTPQELLVELRRLGVRLEVEGDRLAYYPKSVVPPELTEALRRQKLHVIASIQRAPQRRPSEDSPHSVATDERCMGEVNRRDYPIQRSILRLKDGALSGGRWDSLQSMILSGAKRRKN